MRTITLQDKAVDPSTSLRLIVEEEEGGIERWREFRAPKLPPRRTQGAISVVDTDPLQDFIWSQDDWSGGALRPYYRPGDARYALAEGVDARWEGVITMGMTRLDMDYLIGGAGAEATNHETRWTKSSNVPGTTEIPDAWSRLADGVTIARSGDGESDHTIDLEKGQGDFTYRFNVQPESGENSYVYQDLTNPTLYRSRTVRVSCYIKTVYVYNSFAPTIYIDDGQGSPTYTAGQYTEPGTTTVKYGVETSGSEWLYLSAERTINASATQVRIILGDLNATDSAVTRGLSEFLVDNISVTVDGGSNDEFREPIAGIATHAGLLYMAAGRVISQWNENQDKWDAVYIHDSSSTTVNATDIQHFDNKLWVAFGYDEVYVYGSGGIGNWDKSDLSGAYAKAKYFAVARDSAGALALWKTETVNTIKRSTNPVNSGTAWSSAYTIGSSDRTITGLYGAFDTLIVGKEDGLWTYSRTYANTATSENVFQPVSQEWDKAAFTTNFNVGQEWHGYFYTNAASQSFIRWKPGQMQDLTSIIMQPRIPGYGGEVRALVASPHELWVASDIPLSAEAGVFQDFPINMGFSDKTVKIMSLRQGSDGRFNLHTMDEVPFGEIDAMHVYSDTSSQIEGVSRQRWLVAGGRLLDSEGHDYAKTYRWQLPIRSAAPYIDQETPVTKSGNLDTSIWHGGVPGTNKAFHKAIFWVEYLDKADFGAERSITVKYGLDGRDSETITLGTMLGPTDPAHSDFDSPNEGDFASKVMQTLYFQDATKSGSAIDPTVDAVGRTIQMRFSFAHTSPNVGVDPPRIHAFEIHSALRPVELRTWEMFVRIGQDMIQESGYYDPESKTEKIALFKTLEQQVYPIYFKHTYDGHAGFDEESTIYCHITDRERVSVGDEYEIHRLVLQEAETSA